MNDVISYKDYLASVHYSNEDDVFFGKILGIDDLITFEGQSVNELKDALKDAVEDYLQICKAQNKPAEKSYKGSFNVRIPTTLHKDAAMTASRKQLSLNDFVKKAIDYAVRHADKV